MLSVKSLLVNANVDFIKLAYLSFIFTWLLNIALSEIITFFMVFIFLVIFPVIKIASLTFLICFWVNVPSSALP